MPPSRSWNARCRHLLGLMLPLLVGLCALAATPNQEALIQVLFGDQPGMAGLDANHDGALTVADILLLGPLFDGTVSQFVPHAMGDRLVYRVTDPLGNVTTDTTLVTSGGTVGPFVVDDREVNAQQQAVRHELQTYNDTGLQLFFTSGTDFVRNLKTACSPPLLRLSMPVIAGQTFSTTTRCEVRLVSSNLFVGFIDRTDTFTPIELVDSLTVPAGTFTQVVHIHGRTNLSGDFETDEIYFAPGVGAILQLQTSGAETTRHELIDGTIGGLPVTR